jgi:ABC-2 type transport system ATP-binding protein
MLDHSPDRPPRSAPVVPAAPEDLAIEVRGLHKSFGDQQALAGVDLAVPRGTVMALLGPNGAGKTTVVNVLSTLMRADAGTARVLGRDVGREPREVRRTIGVTGQFSAVDALLTAEENLLLMADLNHLPRPAGRVRVAELLATFGLTDVAGKQVGRLSGGMTRRLDLAMTLVGSPQVVFLDEPTTGLDPRGRHELWDLVRGLVADGTTILLTTQYLEEADQLASAIALIDEGRVVAHGTPAELKRRVPGGHIAFTVRDVGTHRRASAAFPGAVGEPESLTVTVPMPVGVGEVAAMRDVLDRLDRAGVAADHLTIETPDLDDVFFALTGAGAPGSQGRRPAPGTTTATSTKEL